MEKTGSDNRSIEERLALLEAAVISIQGLLTRYDANMTSLADKFQTSRQWSWQTVTGGLVAMTVIIGLLSQILVNPVSQKTAVLELRMDAAEQRVDRNREQIAAISSMVASNKSEIDARLVEIETQFCAGDIVRNLMHASDLRNTAILFQKAGITYPISNAYYPEICQRHPQGR